MTEVRGQRRPSTIDLREEIDITHDYFGKRNIRVGIIGAGAMGKGLFYQCHITSGFECVALADIRQERAVACAEWLKRNYCQVDNLVAANHAIDSGQLAICENGNLVTNCDQVDVVIEASSSIIEAGKFAVSALTNRKHLVLMNSEIDLIFGPYLLELAQKHGVIYTSCDGDQHGVIKRLVDKMMLWGFDLVMVGNIKGFLDRYSNPTKIIPEAEKRNLDYRMATAYTDGTKLNIEMALVSNALGISTLTPGMLGPKAEDVHQVFQLYDFETLWAERQQFADYILGAEPGGGVFAIGYCDNEYQQYMLNYYKMGKGPFYLFYRPYHLCHIEALECVANAVHYHKPLLQPTAGFRTNVYAYAKRDLRHGEKLDGIGGYTCYGLIENAFPDGNNGLPICLADNVTLQQDIGKDEKILISDIIYDEYRTDFQLYSKSISSSGGRARKN
jgi:predicted homoserine dehydrogenase-like protein